MDILEDLRFNLTLDLVPFFNIFREDVEEQFNSLAQDLERCCTENANVEIIHAGSGFDGLFLPHLDRLTTWNTDADHMIIRRDFKVHEGGKIRERNTTESDEREQHLPGREEHITIEEEDGKVFSVFDAAHAGYTHLIPKQFSQPIEADFIRQHCLQNMKFIEECKDSIPLNRTALMTLGTGCITGPSYSLPSSGGTFTVNRDFVYGLKCAFWPSQAEEWIHRKREHGWPNTAMVSSISAQGCHIVPVGSHNSVLQEFEWRFSFSVAEGVLARSLSDYQILAYSVLKALIKNEMKQRGIDVFASYHLKTCLFWFLEEKGTDSWDNNSLGKNILDLLVFFITFYARECLPNYFISQNNMLDHRSSEEIQTACHALRDMRYKVTQSLCQYIEVNQSLPVSFDTPLTVLTQNVQDNCEKFLQNCKYNFLVMAMAYILKKEQNEQVCHNSSSLVHKAKLIHRASMHEDLRVKLDVLLAEVLGVAQTKESLTSSLVLSLLEEYLSTDHDKMKVTESSAVALAVFNVFLTLHPSSIHAMQVKMNSLAFHRYITNPSFKECLFWAARVHEAYSDVIYDFVVTKWKNGPRLCTDNDEAQKFMKLLMVILGKPTKQARAVTGSLAKRTIEGQMFLMMRFLADYLLHVHSDCCYVAFQAAAFLMGKSVLAEIQSWIKWTACPQSRARAVELVLSKQELHAELSKDEFAKLVEMRRER